MRRVVFQKGLDKEILLLKKNMMCMCASLSVSTILVDIKELQPGKELRSSCDDSDGCLFVD